MGGFKGYTLCWHPVSALAAPQPPRPRLRTRGQFDGGGGDDLFTLLPPATNEEDEEGVEQQFMVVVAPARPQSFPGLVYEEECAWHSFLTHKPAGKEGG